MLSGFWLQDLGRQWSHVLRYGIRNAVWERVRQEDASGLVFKMLTRRGKTAR